MRRMLMLLTVALVMAAMAVAIAMPAFADPINRRNVSAPNCSDGNTAAYENPAGHENAYENPELAIRNVRATAALNRVYVDVCGRTLNPL
jgi:hypothetical protein